MRKGSKMEQLQQMEEQLKTIEARALVGTHSLGEAFSKDIDNDQFQCALADILSKDAQIGKLNAEIDSVVAIERVSSRRASQAVALCEAKMAAMQRHALELKQKVSSREKRIGNLEDTIDALSGRVETEVSRGEKLGTQNAALRELLDKQAKVRLTVFSRP
mmetsp:Transcript_80913/g.158100  ORF Transcript_80913/g.158100 Transcript_80913/m.158100 type:complete len:161 (+) Transcript_80913:2-484(+)